MIKFLQYLFSPFKVYGYETLEKVKEVRAVQGELEDQLNRIKYSQSEMNEQVEKLKSDVEDIISKVYEIDDDACGFRSKLDDIVENQEKLFSLQNKMFQLLQQQQVERR